MNQLDKNNYGIIMAGGVGSRFWPLSRTARPKQFLDIMGVGRTFLQQTFDRLARVIPMENIYVVTNTMYKDLVAEQLPQLGVSQVLLEPLRRNTAPCIAYATYKINALNPNANIVVAPSDHVILKEDRFELQIRRALEFAASNKALITLGVKPDRPETAYGYIQVNSRVDFNDFDNLYKVKTFTEKPNEEMASVFIETGEFYWNSGIFVWSAPAIKEAFEKYLDEIASPFRKGSKYFNTADEPALLKKIYSESQSISIDYGIMEKADNVYVLTVDFQWSDMGSWGALYESKAKDSNGNLIKGDNVFTYDTKNCIVELSDERIVVLQGLDGYIVAESKDRLMICKREDEKQIKKFVTDVKIKKGDSLL